MDRLNGLIVRQVKEINGFTITQVTDNVFLTWKDGELVTVSRTVEEAEAWITAPVIDLDKATGIAVMQAGSARADEDMSKYLLYCIDTDPETGWVRISPMNGENYITIHGEAEAELFIDHLRDCIRSRR